MLRVSGGNEAGRWEVLRIKYSNPSCHPKAPEPTRPEREQMENERAVISEQHTSEGLHSSIEQLLKFRRFLLLCQGIIPIRMEELNHGNVTEPSILHVAGLPKSECLVRAGLCVYYGVRTP